MDFIGSMKIVNLGDCVITYINQSIVLIFATVGLVCE